MCDNPKKFRENKVHYMALVNVGKYLYNLFFKKQNEEDENVVVPGINELDITAFHAKLLKHLKDTAPNLLKAFKELKDKRNHIQHTPETGMKQYTDLRILQETNNLRDLFGKILNEIKVVHDDIDIANHKQVLNDKLDQEMNLKKAYVVTDSEVEPFLNELRGRKCPSKVTVDILEDPERCSDLVILLEWLATIEDLSVWLKLRKSYFENDGLAFYDTTKYLTPLITNNKCQLEHFRGSLPNEKIPATLKQFYVRIRSDQIEELNNHLQNLPQLWSLGVYLDFPQNVDMTVDPNSPSSLPPIEFKYGKQLGLRYCAHITIDNIDWIVGITKTLTKEHQLDTLEFYQTHLNTDEDIKRLLQAVHDANIHVTTWIKLQNSNHRPGDENHTGLNDFAKHNSLKEFKFLRPWSPSDDAAIATGFDTSMETSEDGAKRRRLGGDKDI